MFFFLVVANFLLLFITPFFNTSVRSLAGSLISLSKPLEFSLLNWPDEKYSALGIGGWSRRLTRSKSWDRMYHVKARQKHFFFLRPTFGLAPNTWYCSDVMFLLTFLGFPSFLALLNYLCFSSISLAVQRRTPLGIRQKHSQILLYMHRFRIVSSVNSWVARLLHLLPTFRFVRLGVQRENHRDCASSSHG